MAVYANDASVLWIESFPNTPSIDASVLLARLFPLTSPRVAVKEMDRVTVPAPSAARVGLPFTQDVADETRWNQIWQRPLQQVHAWEPPTNPSLCVVLTDAQQGVIFRSPWVAALAPGAPADPEGFIDILVPEVQVTTAATINADLATRVSRGDFNNPPQDPTTVVTSATIVVGTGSLTLTVLGTRVTGGFTFTVEFAVEPAETPFYLDYDNLPLHARQINASVSFTAGPGHGLETVLLNILSGWIADPMAKAVLDQISAGLVSSARTQVARLAGIPSVGGQPPVLPAEVILSVRRIVITASGISGKGPGVYAWGAIGSFGNLVRRLFPGQSNPSKPMCVVMALLAPLFLGADVVEVLQHVRNTTLQSSGPGRRLVALYYEHGREVAALLASRPGLARTAGAIVRAVVDDLRAGDRVSAATRERATTLVTTLLPLASPPLRRDVEETLGSDPWMLLRLVG
jgi:hypothetical protein